ncbi:MAG: GNAT family N-acetyltransferase [Clostridiales bacterium]|nr:GNAT family N-acetyltransferase [Clostridiales bacterium]
MIRFFEMSDYESVYQLWQNTSGVGLRSIDDSREGIERFVRRNPRTNFVAEEDGRIIGAVLSGHDGRRGNIYHLCVDGSHRRRGIGRQLVDKVIEAMKDEKITALSLVCFTDNETGNNFWSKLGWIKRPDLISYRLYLNE